MYDTTTREGRSQIMNYCRTGLVLTEEQSAALDHYIETGSKLPAMRTVDVELAERFEVMNARVGKCYDADCPACRLGGDRAHTYRQK
jgi:hypothetical protein